MSVGPYSFSASRIAAISASLSRTSTFLHIEFSNLNDSIISSLLAINKVGYPAFENAFAVAAPIPLLAPVITAKGFFIFYLTHHN